MLDRLEPVFRRVLEDPDLVLTPDLRMDGHPRWDSISNVHLLLAVEDALGVQFTSTQVAAMRSVADILVALAPAEVPVKVIVCDLDGTLWDGLAGEETVDITPAHRVLWDRLVELNQQGILLAICSKNTAADLWPWLGESAEMFAAIEASWDPKPLMIERLAAQLHLGLDTFLVLDDNPVERAAIRAALPMVRVVEANDPVAMATALAAYAPTVVTAEDRARAAQYRVAQLRAAAEAAAPSLEAFLADLQMVATHGPVTEAEMARAVQMCQRTTQYTLTSRQHDAATIRKFGYTRWVRLQDRFGDHGIVGLMLATTSRDIWHLVTLAMSCRVAGRGLEEYMLDLLVRDARAANVGLLDAEYLPTDRNQPVADLLPRTGWQPLGDNRYRLHLPHYQWRSRYITSAT